MTDNLSGASKCALNKGRLFDVAFGYGIVLIGLLVAIVTVNAVAIVLAGAAFLASAMIREYVEKKND